MSCATCTDARRGHVFPCDACPDVGVMREGSIPIGGLGSAEDAPWRLDYCPAYYQRDPVEHPEVPWAVDTRSAYHVACEARYAFEHGAMGRFDALPGKLHDGIALVVTEENRLSKLRMDRAKKDSGKGSRTIKVV